MFLGTLHAPFDSQALHLHKTDHPLTYARPLLWQFSLLCLASPLSAALADPYLPAYKKWLLFSRLKKKLYFDPIPLSATPFLSLSL
jgi:hypothetical protein